MTNQQFNKRLMADIEKIANTLTNKAGEYAKNDDRFHNFKIVKQVTDLVTKKDTTEYVMFALAAKHFASIVDILNGKPYDAARLDEKFLDMVNYLLLIKSSLLEKINISELP